MGRFDATLRAGNLVLLALLVYAAWDLMPTLLKRRAANEVKRDPYLDWVDPSKGVKIIHFYAYPGVVVEGDSASLCFGVANAKSVRITPAVDNRLWPTFNRCFDVSPTEDTRYTLTATDAAGKEVTSSFVLAVQPNPGLGARIQYFEKRGAPTRDYLDRTVQLVCFQTWNAVRVKVEPPAFPESAVLKGCFYAVAGRETQFTLSATDKYGHMVRKQLTVGGS